MIIEERLAEKKMTLRQCSRYLSIPYSSLYNIAKGKASIDRCEYGTLRKIADFLDCSIEDLRADKTPFYYFRSNVQHTIKFPWLWLS